MVRRAAASVGLDSRGAKLLHHYSNAVFVLPAERAVARVAAGHDVLRRINRTQTVTRWLVDVAGLGATRPLDAFDAVAIGRDAVVSFWIYYPQPDRPPQMTSAHLGSLLRQLHAVQSPPVELQPWVPLVSLEATVRDNHLSRALTTDDRDWLLARIVEARDELARLHWPLGQGLIHGDAWAGNVLWKTTPDLPPEAILGDWDWVAYGPREVDLVPTWHATVRYGRDGSWSQQFADEYGYDLRTWSGFESLLRMRDLVQITGPLRRAHDERYRRILSQRLTDIRIGDTTSRWRAV